MRALTHSLTHSLTHTLPFKETSSLSPRFSCWHIAPAWGGLAMQSTTSTRPPPSWKEPPSTSRRASCFSFAGIKQRMVASVVGGSAADSESWAIADLPNNFYDLEAKTAKGEKYPFGDLRSKAVLVVNVASA